MGLLLKGYLLPRSLPPIHSAVSFKGRFFSNCFFVSINFILLRGKKNEKRDELGLVVSRTRVKWHCLVYLFFVPYLVLLTTRNMMN
jgi:hypothetical protein